MAEAFPFPYLGHGVLAAPVETAGGAYLAFAEPVPDDDRPSVMRGCPAPIHGNWAWGPNLACCEAPSHAFEAIDAAGLARFAADVEAWARAVHAIHPLEFFVGPIAAEAPSPWGAESERALPAIMIPFVERYAAENVADLVDSTDVARATTAAGVFGAVALSSLLRTIPRTPDRELNKRLDRMRARFGLGPKGTMVILPT